MRQKFSDSLSCHCPKNLLVSQTAGHLPFPFPPPHAVLTLVHPDLQPREAALHGHHQQALLLLPSGWSLIPQFPPSKVGSGWPRQGIRGHSCSQERPLSATFYSFHVSIIFPSSLWSRGSRAPTLSPIPCSFCTLGSNLYTLSFCQKQVSLNGPHLNIPFSAWTLTDNNLYFFHKTCWLMPTEC